MRNLYPLDFGVRRFEGSYGVDCGGVDVGRHLGRLDRQPWVEGIHYLLAGLWADNEDSVVDVFPGDAGDRRVLVPMVGLDPEHGCVVRQVADLTEIDGSGDGGFEGFASREEVGNLRSLKPSRVQDGVEDCGCVGAGLAPAPDSAAD